ncbi:YjfB family protein [Clostridium frigidicarnis]|uniref:Putative motility protein n=1 Tax=Clostridium frigidicarnis TaxID=84698 RepID=A0A1I1A043_9CLOT|nr:YjfB family protein [Clostridium frigidicarnis]SFB29763.1 Putative motility protein [Clostridium frigidicarnis]
MDIASMSMGLSQARVMQGVQLSLMKLQMNNGKEVAQNMIHDMGKLTNVAKDPSKGNSIDSFA